MVDSVIWDIGYLFSASLFKCSTEYLLDLNNQSTLPLTSLSILIQISNSFAVIFLLALKQVNINPCSGRLKSLREIGSLQISFLLSLH